MNTSALERCLLLRPDDSVGLMTRALTAGTDVLAGDVRVRLRDDVPAGHKVALLDIPTGGQVLKYGQAIGVATRPIAAGEHVHTHNLAFADFERDYAFGVDAKGHPGAPAGPPTTFNGIIRADGQIATRNYLGILTSVNCSATVARMVANQFQEGSELMAAFPNLDGVVALTHGSGCGMAGEGEGFDLLRRTLSGYARHPNLAGLLVLGLGCEVNQVRSLAEGFDLPSTTPFLSMTIQEMGGTRATVREATARLRDLAVDANTAERTPVPASELVLGLECGGSDGYSGITANPALGVAADLLVQAGGTAVLGETPEILRGRAPADPTGGEPEGGRAPRRADPLVGGVREALWRQSGQQPLARQQRGRSHDHPGEVARRRGQRGQRGPRRGLRVRRARNRKRLCFHGHSRLRPCFGHRDGGGGRQCGLFHHWPGVGVRLQTRALPKTGDQQRHLHADV